MQKQLKFGILIEEYQKALREFEDFLIDVAGLDNWDSIRYNEDWCRIDIWNVNDDARISKEVLDVARSEYAVPYIVLHHENGIDTYCDTGWRVDRRNTIDGKTVINFIPDNDGWKNSNPNSYFIKEDL